MTRCTVIDLHDFTQRYPRLFVLTGAGVSVDSGIPGYRDENGNWKRSVPVIAKRAGSRPRADGSSRLIASAACQKLDLAVGRGNTVRM